MTDKKKMAAHLKDAGLDVLQELKKLIKEDSEIDIPFVRFQNDKFIIDLGESYGAMIKPLGDTLEAVVFEEQYIRSFPGEEMNCKAIDNIPIVNKAHSYRCSGCPDAEKCVMRIRLWILLEMKPFIMILPPENMRSWKYHKLKLLRAGLPLIAVNTMFTKTSIDMNGLANKEHLAIAAQARNDLQHLMGVVSD